MVFPNKTKYSKYQKNKISGQKRNGHILYFGNYGLQAVQAGRVTQFQLEACRKFLQKKLKRHGKVWINIFPHWPLTKKSTGIRMGKGKGEVSSWFCRIKKYSMLFEIQSTSQELAKEALKGASFKLALPTKLIIKN